jgi:hypothetical protein
MPEKRKQLRDTLIALKDELNGVRPESDKQEAALRELLRDVQDFLRAEDQGEQEPQAMSEKIEQGIDQFEATHPKLALYLNDALQMLSSLGI